MRRSRHTPRQLLGLTLTLVGLLSWHILPIAHPELAVRAANRVRGAEPTGQTVSRVVINGRVAFVSSETNGSQSDIYTMNPDGSDRKQLTFSQEYEDHPVWSPDGTKIAFASVHWTGNGGYSEIFVMNADGSDQRRLTQSKFDQSPTWSPDGTKIAFWRLDSITTPSSWGIFVMNADGSDQRAVASTSNFYGPAWSPDGLKFAVVDNGIGTYGIYLINVDGSNPTQITQPPASPSLFYDYGPAWSPDGSKITFARCVDSNGFGCYTTSHLWGVNADGSNPTKLTDTLASTHTWSPDGTKIIFGSVDDSLEPRDLFVMNPDGSGLTNITNTDGTREWSPSWQPLSLPPVVNPIDDPQFFVRQHYLDFLNRQPDATGLNFWIDNITSCGFDAHCVEVKRIDTSAAFFLSIEFQETGYLVYRIYKSAYGDIPGTPVPLRLNEFLPDTQQIGQGVIVNQTGWEQVLENNKQAFMTEFVQRSRFTSAYPTLLTPEQFVDQLFLNSGVTPSATDRADAINEFGSASTTTDTAARARALRRVAENSTLALQEFNRAFVLMQYFGYLRRNPNDPPEPGLNFNGYNFWLTKLNQFNGNFRDAEMVKAFLVSTEYRQRFGQP
jgi:Tol biopolymer transport system component